MKKLIRRDYGLNETVTENKWHYKCNSRFTLTVKTCLILEDLRFLLPYGSRLVPQKISTTSRSTSILVDWRVKSPSVWAFRMMTLLAVAHPPPPSHDHLQVTWLSSESLARSSTSCVPAFVEPCGSNQGSRVGASVDHTSVRTQGGWSFGGIEWEEGENERGVCWWCGQSLASVYRWVSGLACDTDVSRCHLGSGCHPAVPLACFSWLEVMYRAMTEVSENGALFALMHGALTDSWLLFLMLFQVNVRVTSWSAQLSFTKFMSWRRYSHSRRYCYHHTLLLQDINCAQLESKLRCAHMIAPSECAFAEVQLCAFVLLLLHF